MTIGVNIGVEAFMRGATRIEPVNCLNIAGRSAGGSNSNVCGDVRPAGAAALAALLLLLAAPVRAAGPDVIVSNIGSPPNQNGIVRNGEIGGITAFSMQSVSCNLGTAEAIWDTCTNGGPTCNQHPVIAQNAYRLMDGRFEQIGMSWVKHGSCGADEQDLVRCATCTPNLSCAWLGVGCIDVYTTSLNGLQVRLGPRSEINAATGQFSYPFTLGWNLSGDAIYKRLQIHNSDLDPALNPGAQYFCEVQYVNTDEQLFGNQYNNVSWRPLSVVVGGMGGFFLSHAGATVQQQSAIHAWQANDAGVSLVDLYVPSDGRYILGCKTTDLGGGAWRYEYALYNMNSDRGGGSFAVPVPAGATATNRGFHDADYHSGEPYDPTDWNTSDGGGWLTWSSPQAFAQNPNSNALRWGTTYNFRFDCDLPPVDGAIELGYFKPGAPASSAIAARVPRPCACLGDLDASGALDGDDVAAFAAMYLGIDPYGVCGDLSAPSGAPLDAADLSAFVSALLTPGTCP